jgi:hypothetical protein
VWNNPVKKASNREYIGVQQGLRQGWANWNNTGLFASPIASHAEKWGLGQALKGCIFVVVEQDIAPHGLFVQASRIRQFMVISATVKGRIINLNYHVG